MKPTPTVLVVDDDETLLLTAKRQLRELNIQCATATNGVEALQQVRENAYCLIFMDLVMPEMDGISATLRIREEELRDGRVRTPIIAMTAFEEQDKCLGAGMDDFILKPMLTEHLQTAVNKFCAAALE